MLIRQETDNDFHEIRTVVREAFATAEHSDGNEQDLVTALRKGDAYLPELSLVAEIDGQVVGHIMFTVAHVGAQKVLVLAPLSVLPKNQKQGIGTALIKAGHQIAQQLGYQYALVLGSEKYYPRLGYIPAHQLGIQAPFEVTQENFMALRLQENAAPICGVVNYAPEFGL